MDKKAKKRIDVLSLRITTLRQQLAGARKQMDDPDEVKNLEKTVCRRRGGIGESQRLNAFPGTASFQVGMLRSSAFFRSWYRGPVCPLLTFLTYRLNWT